MNWQRARDQRPDLAGIELKRRVLERLVALDPEPDEFDPALMRIVEELGAPTGPTRAIALMFRKEWRMACETPEWIGHLLTEAIQQREKEPGRGRRVSS